MKLNITHLAPYLPYGLKVQASWSIDGFGGLCTSKAIGLYRDELLLEPYTILHKHIPYRISIDRTSLSDPDTKPLLLHMSSLYTEMEDGTVPIVELAKIATGVQDWEVIEYQPTFGSRKIKLKSYLVAYNKEYNFRFFIRDKDFYLYDVDGLRECTHQNQLDLFEYLFSHHFDVWNLIGQNLAIDKTKIK